MQAQRRKDVATAVTRCAFTIAVGKSTYLEMAIALARSFLRHNVGSDIRFTVVTDRSVSERPRDIAEVDWIEVPTDAYGRGFTPKLHLNRLAPTERSLFIDADCLVTRALAPVFEALAGRPVGVLGRPIRDGDWFGDVASITSRLGVDAMPRFNGGIYYLERGRACAAIYETARGLLPRYDELGFVRLRGSENDEVLMSAALAIHGVPGLVEMAASCTPPWRLRAV